MTDSTITSKRGQCENSIGVGGSERLLLITGMSGAGKSTTLKVLEDLGYEAVDNLPLSLVRDFVGGDPGQHLGPLAIGVDIRTRDFSVDLFFSGLNALHNLAQLKVNLVFLDCDNEILRQRYTETRRRHPMVGRLIRKMGVAPEGSVTDGIKHERWLIGPLRDRADLVIDTSHLTLNEFRSVLKGHFGNDINSTFAVSVISFSYRRGIPREADLVFDVRFLSNPHYEKDLRSLTGLDEAVGNYISSDSDFATFYDSLVTLLEPLFPRYRAEGKSYLTIAVGCTGGQHRSVYVAERLKAWLMTRGECVSIMHREI